MINVKAFSGKLYLISTDFVSSFLQRECSLNSVFLRLQKRKNGVYGKLVVTSIRKDPHHKI